MIDSTACKKTSIFTFGYGNRKDYDLLLRYIEQFNIDYIIDVRIKPRAWTRKWYGDALENLCSLQGIRYISKPSLGNTSGRSHWIPPEPSDAKASLSELSELLETQNILLLCAELDFTRCHRTEVASQLQALTDSAVTHLK